MGGSEQRLFIAGLRRLENIQGYICWHAPTGVIDANDSLIVFLTILVQVQLMRDNNTSWGDWIYERAIAKSFPDCQYHLE